MDVRHVDLYVLNAPVVRIRRVGNGKQRIVLPRRNLQLLADRGGFGIVLAALADLYFGIVTDTDRFKFRSVTNETLRIASRLLEMGVDLDEINARLYLESPNFFKFKAYIYKKIKKIQ